MTTWREHKKELLKDAKFKKAYDDLEPEYRLARELIQARISKKLTQAQLADQAGVSRMVISRLESGISNPTLETISKVASVLGKEVKLVGSH